MRAAAYVRLSRETEDTTSPERQRRVCRQHIEQRGWDHDLKQDTFEDLDVSAYKGVRRPGLEALLDRLDQYDVIVFWRLDRLARSTVQFGHIMEACEAADTALVSATEPFDLTSPMGEAMASVLMVFARLESRTIATRVAASKEHLARQGRWHGGKRPFGFEVVEADDGTYLAPHPEEGPMVQEAIERVLAGESLRAIANDWINDGRTERKQLNLTLGKTLRDPALLGLRVHRGEVIRDDDGLPVVAHEALTDQWTFRRLQSELERRSSRQGRRHQSSDQGQTLLAGLVYCGECGSRMDGNDWRKNPKNARYACAARSQYGKEACVGTSSRARSLEEFVTEAVLSTVDDRTVAQAKRRAAKARQSGGDDAAAKRAERLRTALDQLAEDRYERGLYDGRDGGERYARQYRKLTQQLDQATAEAERQHVEPSLADLVNGTNLRDEWEDLDRTRQRTIIGAVLEAVVVNKAEKASGPRWKPDRIDLQWRV